MAGGREGGGGGRSDRGYELDNFFIKCVPDILARAGWRRQSSRILSPRALGRERNWVMKTPPRPTNVRRPMAEMAPE